MFYVFYRSFVLDLVIFNTVEHRFRALLGIIIIICHFLCWPERDGDGKTVVCVVVLVKSLFYQQSMDCWMLFFAKVNGALY